MELEDMDGLEQDVVVGEMPEVISNDAVAVYDPQNGTIIHMHYITVYEGAERLDEEFQELDALECAQMSGCNVDGLETLCIPDHIPTDKLYEVDCEKKILIELPPEDKIENLFTKIEPKH